MDFRVNGRDVRVDGHEMARLLDVLRTELHLTGTKEGCGEGECGACAVLIDGALVNSCLVPLAQVEGRQITTIEGLTAGADLLPLQRAFVDQGGSQCGICTPGMVMAAAALLAENPRPSLEAVQEALAGNLCRCTGYLRIFESIRAVSRSAEGRG